MIDKTYINFYSNWYYKKIENDYQAREKGKNNAGIIAEIDKCSASEFVKRLSKTGAFKSSLDLGEKEMEIIRKKYPWIKPFHKEILISKIRKPIILSLFVTAIKNEDFNLSDYILVKYNLTEGIETKWKLDTLYKHYSVFLEVVKYGDSFYAIANNGDLIEKTIIYNGSEKDCVVNGVRYLLSEELIEQLNDANKTFYKTLTCVFSKENGYNLADFKGGRYIGYKRLSTGEYHFIVIKKLQEKFTYLCQKYTSALSFIKSFDFKRWGFVSHNTDTLEEDALPLYLSAKESGDKFLQCEIKYVSQKATQLELDYLNQNDVYEKFKRVYFKKDAYDLQDVDILKVSSKVARWIGEIIECETIIEGVKLTIRYKPRAINRNEMVVYRWNERLTLRFTDSVIEKITQLLKE